MSDIPAPAAGNALLTSTEAASLASVTPTIIARWADEGLLPVVHTAKGFRRFERAAVERLMRLTLAAKTRAGTETDAWMNSVLAGNPQELDLRLMLAHSRLATWCRVADELGAVLIELGRRWQDGELSIGDEHRVSGILGRALARVGDRIPVPQDGPRCLLACAGNDEHTLGLSLADLCLREHGHLPVWLGRRTPVQEVIRMVMSGQAELVAMSASIASDDAEALGQIAEAIGSACKAHGVSLVLGGSGAWPEVPSHGLRVNAFSAFHDFHDFLHQGAFGQSMGRSPKT
jgi:methylmalonyl-CoA mutase cobalamin-binding subunit